MNPFWNATEGRIRSAFRIVIQLILFILFILGLIFVMSDILMPFIPQGSPLLTVQIRNNFLFGELTSPLIPMGGVLLSMFLAARYLDRRRFRDFGFHPQRGWRRDFLFGLGLGALLMALIFLVELSLGWIRVTGFFLPQGGHPFWLGILVDLITFICVGFYEEMLMRGYILRNLAEGLNLKWLKPSTALILAVAVSSLLFSFLHLANPGASLLSFIDLFLAGIFLSLGFILTGELALPIGLHIAWNFFQGAVFGFPVSGTAAAGPLILIEQVNTTWLTGGAFGPEAGAVGVLAMLLGAGLICLWVKRWNGSVQLETRLAIYQKPEVAQEPSSTPARG